MGHVGMRCGDTGRHPWLADWEVAGHDIVGLEGWVGQDILCLCDCIFERFVSGMSMDFPVACEVPALGSGVVHLEEHRKHDTCSLVWLWVQP